MKKYYLYCLMGLLALGSCSRDSEDDDEDDNSLEAYLDGTFSVESVDYNGTVSFMGQMLPVSGTDEEPEGNYDFDRQAGEATYSVTGTLLVNFAGNEIPIPLDVESEDSEYTVMSESRFTIEDETFGMMVYDVEQRDESGFSASTEVELSDPNVDLNLTLHFSR